VSLENEIKAYARTVGFDVVAIGPAEPYLEAWRELERRRADGRYPAFTEPDIALRCDPKRLLPSARSVIAVGVSYLTRQRSRPTRAGSDPKGSFPATPGASITTTCCESACSGSSLSSRSGLRSWRPKRTWTRDRPWTAP
jgi:Uncharacterized Fe-S protein